MKHFLRLLNWLLFLFLILTGLLYLEMGRIDYLLMIILLGVVVSPLTNQIIERALRGRERQSYRILLAGILVIIFGVMQLAEYLGRTDIYRDSKAKAEQLEIYEEKLQQWYTPFGIQYIMSSYGRIHIIECGAKDKPAMILVSGRHLGAWSWVYNIVNLSEDYHIYAIDIPGAAGRSSLAELRRFPVRDEEISGCFLELLSELGEERVILGGAGSGGNLVLRLAILEPEKVEKAFLLSPTGFGTKIWHEIYTVLSDIFPVRMINNKLKNDIMGDSPVVEDLCGDWLDVVLRGVEEQMTPDRVFTQKELEQVQVPVMLILADKDRVTGPAGRQIERAGQLGNVQIKVLESGRLVHIEKSGEVNKLISRFLGQKEQ